ncbi:rbcL, partial [Symbiodinium sp. KB8]
MRRAFPAQFLHYHAAGAVEVRGLHSRRSYSAFVHSKLARLLGASSALLEVDLKAATVASLPNPEVRQALCEMVGVLRGDDTRGVLFEQQWEGMKQTLPVISGDLHALHLPFLFEALGHSDILLTPTVSYAKKDPTPGARSFRAAEQAWRVWRDGGSNVSLPEFILDYARSDTDLLQVFKAFPEDADVLCPGWRDQLTDVLAELPGRHRWGARASEEEKGRRACRRFCRPWPSSNWH